MDIELEPWYNMDESGKMLGMGIHEEDLGSITPKRKKIHISHLKATIPDNGYKARPIPSWQTLNYCLFMCKYTNHYGYHIDLYAAYLKSRVPLNADEEKRLDIIYEATEELFDWSEDYAFRRS